MAKLRKVSKLQLISWIPTPCCPLLLLYLRRNLNYPKTGLVVWQEYKSSSYGVGSDGRVSGKAQKALGSNLLIFAADLKC